MRARLLSLQSPDAPGGDLAAFEPSDPAHFSLLVQAVIGPADGDGGESFDFRVCTPGWLAAAERPRGYEFVRHTLLVDRWIPALVEQAISDLCGRSDERDWDALSQSLARFGRWEFEAYRE